MNNNLRSRFPLKYLAYSFVLITTLFTFLSCENFLQGEDVKEEITKTIEYNNAPSYTINVEAETNSGIVKTPATGEISKKVTDVFKIRFIEAEGYQFIKWEAVVKGMSTGEKAADYIEFENSESLETNVTFKKASSQTIVLKAICLPKLTYTFAQGGGSVNTKDSPIIFSFNEKLSACGLYNTPVEYVSISDLTEEAVSTYYDAPEVRSKSIIFPSKTSNGYIPIPKNNTRIIKINIPKESIWYEYITDNKDTIRVYLDSDINETFIINDETSKKTQFKFELQQKYDEITDQNVSIGGSLRIDGEVFKDEVYPYSVGKSFALNYKIPVGYMFYDWEFTHTYTENGNTLIEKITQDKLFDDFGIKIEPEIDDDTDEKGFDKKSRIVQAQVRILKYTEDVISIKPVCYEYLTVTFNNDDPGKVYNRDGKIELIFNKKIPQNCGDKIVIKIPGLPEGKTVDNYFTTPPSINYDNNENTIVTFESKALLPLLSEKTNTITVTLPANAEELYYEPSSGIKIPLEDDISYSYIINSETNKKTSIKVVVPDDPSDVNLEKAGQIRLNDEKTDGKFVNYSIEKTLNLKYILADKENYIFDGWRIKREFTEGETKQTIVYEKSDFINENLENFNLSLISDETDSAHITITITNNIDGEITISPIVTKIKKSKIKFLVDDDYSTAGEFKIDGIIATGANQEIIPGRSLKLRFKLTSGDFYFRGWKVEVEDQQISYEQSDFKDENLSSLGLSVSYDDNESAYGYEELTKIAQVNITVNNFYEKTIVISPVVVPIPTASVTIDGSNGKFSPIQGTYIKKEKIFETLSFDPDGDYEFLRWQIYNENTGDELNNADYITIKDLTSERTSFAVVRVPDLPTEGNEGAQEIKLAIRPIVTERPQILSYSPMYDAKGSLLDSSIQVMFDYEMDEESIYYTEIELESLKNDLGMNSADYDPSSSPNQLLSFNKGGKERFYGYKDKTGTYFKNISIKNNRNEANLNDYFADPSFDTKRTLSIRTRRDKPLPGYSQVSVAIDGNFFYLKDDKKITMNGSKKWVYQVRNEGDRGAPELLTENANGSTIENPFKFEYKGFDDNTVTLSPQNSQTKPTSDLVKGGMASFDYIPIRNGNAVIDLDGVIVDQDSGLSPTFSIKYRQLYNSAYKKSENIDTVYSYDVEYEGVMGLTAYLPKNISIKSLEGAGGLYEMWFEFKDLSNNTFTYPELPKDENGSPTQDEPAKKYYIAFENIAPTVKELNVDDSKKQNNLDIKWASASATDTEIFDIDIREVIVRYRADEANNYEQLPEGSYFEELLSSTDINARKYALSGLNSAQHYSIDLIAKDYAGNQTVYNLDDFTLPSAPESVTLPEDGPFDTNFVLDYTLADTDFSETRIRYKAKDIEDVEDNWTLLTNPEISDSLSVAIEGLENAKKYQFKVTTYDEKSGKESLCYTVSNALPEYVTKPASISIDGTSFNSTTTEGYIFYYLPKSDFSGIKVLYSVNPDFSNPESYEIPSSSFSVPDFSKRYTVSLSSTTSGALIPGTSYYLKLLTWYDTEDNYVESPIRSTYTKTAPITNLTYSDVTNNSLTANWTKPAGNYSSYIIEYKENSETEWTSVAISDTEKDIESYTITGLVGGKTYNVRVTALVNGSRKSAAVQNSTAPWGLKPNIATDLSAEKIENSSTVRVSWENPVGNYDSLVLQRSLYENFSSIQKSVTITSKDTNYYDVTDLTQGNQYYFRIKASANSYESVSGSISYSTDIDPVSNRSVSVISSTKVQLSWTMPSLAVDGVKVYRSDNTEDAVYTLTSVTPSSSYSWYDTSVLPNHQYTYTITTYKSVGGNTKTAAVSAGTVLTKPANVTSPGATTYMPHPFKDFYVYWTNPEDTSYWNDVRIYSVSGTGTTATTSNTTYVGTVTSKTSYSYYFSDMTPGTTYRYALRTTNANNVYSDFSAIASVSTPLQPASNAYVALSGITANSMTCSWVNPYGSYTLKVLYKLASDTSWTTAKTYSAGSLTGGETSSYTITGLTPGSKYNAKIVIEKNGFTSQETNVKVKLTYGEYTDFWTRPNTPKLAYKSRTANSITYTITKPEGNLDGYQLYYKKSSASSYSGPISIASSKTEYTISNLESGIVYNAYLTATPVQYFTGASSYDSSSSSIVSNITTPTLSVPTGLTAHANEGKVTLTWNKPSGVQNYYSIQYKKSSDSNWSSPSYTSSGYGYYTFSNLEKNVKYDFQIASNYYSSTYDIDYYSNYSSTVSFTSPPPALTSVTLSTDDGMGIIQVNYTSSWNGSVDWFCDGVYIGCSSCSSGSTQTKKLIIPKSKFKRGTTYAITGRTYISQKGMEYNSPSWASYYPGETYGAACTYNYKSDGRIYLDGKYYDYSVLNNIVTSNYTVNKVNTSGSFTSGNTMTFTPYSIGAYEVTQELFEKVMGKSVTSKYYPVSNVSWYGAIAFCNKLSAMLGLDPCYTIGTISNSSWKTFDYSNVPTSNNDDWNRAVCDFTKNGYHLPTEWQWELAARGGSTSASDWSCSYAGSNTRNDVSWNNANSGGSVHQVGGRSQNSKGIFDMTGNLWEFTNDWGNSKPSISATDFTVNYDSSYRTTSTLVLRGGSYSADDGWMYTKYRLVWGSGITNNFDLGFRVCRNYTYNE